MVAYQNLMNAATAPPEYQREVWDEWDTVSMREMANWLSEVTITVEVTFEDGSTGMHAYTITPVANFDEAYSAYIAQPCPTDENPPELFELIEAVG